MTVLPDWLARPALGLAMLHSEESEFPKLATRAAGERFEVIGSDWQDSRFTYGLTLGLTWRFLDWRATDGAALWIPEFTINPTSDIRAVGVGIAFSWWKIVKVGTGLLWTKHKAFDRRAGDFLDHAEDLRCTMLRRRKDLHQLFIDRLAAIRFQ